MQADDRGLILMWGRALRRVPTPAILAAIVEEGPDATESVRIEDRSYALHIITAGQQRGYFASTRPPDEEHIYLAARELFGDSHDTPHVTRIKKSLA